MLDRILNNILEYFFERRTHPVLDTLMFVTTTASITALSYLPHGLHPAYTDMSWLALILTAPWTLAVAIGSLFVGYRTFRGRAAWRDFADGFVVFYGSLLVGVLLSGIVFGIGAICGYSPVEIPGILFGLIWFPLGIFGLISTPFRMLFGLLGWGFYRDSGSGTTRSCSGCRCGVNGWCIPTDELYMNCPHCGRHLSVGDLYP